MYYELENTITPRWFKSLGHALEYAHQQGTRIVRCLGTSA